MLYNYIQNETGLLKLAAGEGRVRGFARGAGNAARRAASNVKAVAAKNPKATAAAGGIAGLATLGGGGALAYNALKGEESAPVSAPAPTSEPVQEPAPVPTPEPTPTVDPFAYRNITAADMKKYRPITAANDMASDMDKWKTWMAMNHKGVAAENADYRKFIADPNAYMAGLTTKQASANLAGLIASIMR